MWECDPAGGVSWPKERVSLPHRGATSVKDSKPEQSEKTPTPGVGRRCWYGGAPVGWEEDAQTEAGGGGMKCQGLSWVNRASMW